jgi:hypothetical protein
MVWDFIPAAHTRPVVSRTSQPQLLDFLFNRRVRVFCRCSSCHTPLTKVLLRCPNLSPTHPFILPHLFLSILCTVAATAVVHNILLLASVNLERFPLLASVTLERFLQLLGLVQG